MANQKTVGGEREREINKHMHKTIGKLRILYSNYNTQGTNQKPKSSETSNYLERLRKRPVIRRMVIQNHVHLFIYQQRYDHVSN